MNRYVISILATLTLVACNKNPTGTVLSRPTPFVPPVTYTPITGIQDMTFGTSGEYKFAGNSYVSLMTLQKNGKILALKSNALEIYRLSTDGILDLSFGVNGKVTHTVNPPIQELRSFFTQSDGKSIIGGTCYNANSKWSFCVFRILEDGQLDSTFGVNGKALYNYSNNDFMTKLVPIPTGGFYAVGYSTDNSFQNPRFLHQKISENGTFEISGILNLGSNSGLYAASVQADGKLVASGNMNASMVTMRFTDSLNLDITFAGMGYTIISNNGSGVADNAIQPDGKILVSGSNYFGEHPTILRLLSNGPLDSNFGSSGIVTLTSFGGASPDLSNSLSKIFVEPNGKILAFAQIKGVSNTTDIGMTRLKPDGIVDNTFGTNGYWEKDFYSNTDFLKDMLVCPDGKVFLLTQAYSQGLGQTVPTIIKMK